MADIKGTRRDDFIHLDDDGQVPPPGANDIPKATDRDDTIDAGRGDDTVFGGLGDDFAFFDVSTDGADSIDLGGGADVVNVDADGATQVRLTFTSSEVGNGNASDSNTMANQDGGLAVRLQDETRNDGLTGPITRTDDEGITFVAEKGVTFDVRDLVSGAARGDQFEVVTLGTNASEKLTAIQGGRPYYINAGMGDDSVVGGRADDFLVGGAGLDRLRGGLGDDSFIGGGGADTITGGRGDDTFISNITTDGADQVDLEGGSDVVTVNATAPTEVRLTFTSSEVGNGSATDSNTMMLQDGGLAVRMQAEDGSDALTGPITRLDDEGVTFVAGVGVTFDVRDLPTGTARGDQFEVVTLGTSNDDELTALQTERPYYINAGQGDDTLTGGKADDFLVGGAGDDDMIGKRGADRYIVDSLGDRVIEKGGQGVDLVLTAIDYTLGDNLENLTLSGTAAVDGTGNDRDNTITGNAAANVLDGKLGTDMLNGGAGQDTFQFSTALGANNVDTILGFSVSDDTIGLDSDVFVGLQAGMLNDEAFTIGVAATEADDRIIYNAANGTLSFDRDGSGGRFEAVAFADIGTVPGLSADDFLIS